MLRVPIIPLRLSTRSGACVHQKGCLGGRMFAQVGVVVCGTMLQDVAAYEEMEGRARKLST